MHVVDIELSDVGSVVDIFDDLEIDFWLAGGWAVDFHYREITRAHSDIDLVVYHSDKDRLHQVLVANGFEVVDDSDPDAEMIYERNGLKVDLSFIKQLSDGSTVSPGWEHWPWPADSFPVEKARLSDVRVRVVSAETLLTSKTGYEANIGESPRPQDIADIEMLKRALQRFDGA